LHQLHTISEFGIEKEQFFDSAAALQTKSVSTAFRPFDHFSLIILHINVNRET